MNALPLTLAALIILHAIPARADPVPAIGCPGDGQTGPIAAPARIEHIPSVQGPAAQRLAFYAAEGYQGVLAPRGWHCFLLYGSDGSVLLVTPEPHGSNDLLDDVKGLVGPAVQLSLSYGDTSGRFEVARTAARLFPSARRYVDRVIAEDIEPKSAFPRGPFPTDRLTRRSRDMVEFQTPPDTEGMGTQSRLLQNHDPISGVAILRPGEDVMLVKLSVRLRPEDQALIPAIVGAVERPAK